MKTFTQISKFAAMAAIAAIGISLYACEEKEKASKPTEAATPQETQKPAEEAKQPKSVKIGTQTWMAENLNIETPNSWCYDNNPENCAKYGRLYTWDAAMKACPAGWHLPSREEWHELINFVGGWETAGTKLKSKSPEWNGTDDYGFSALPGGEIDYDGSAGLGLISSWWTNSPDAWLLNMDLNSTKVNEFDTDDSKKYSVRCVQD